MKISKDKKFASFERSLNNSLWTEILNLTKITAVQENRICKEVYGNKPGKRHGYRVYAEGGPKNGFWINDAEFTYLFSNGFFGNFE